MPFYSHNKLADSITAMFDHHDERSIEPGELPLFFVSLMALFLTANVVVVDLKKS